MTTAVTEEASDTLAGFLAALNELRAQYPQLAEPVRACTCRSDDGTPCVAVAGAFPPGWADEWATGAGRDALAAEQAHWEIVNGTLPPAHSMLPEDPGPPVLYAVRDDALEPLPAQPEHAWMDQMAAALGEDDRDADAAVERFQAVHDEQPAGDEDDWAFDGEDEPADGSNPKPDSNDTPSSDDEGPGCRMKEIALSGQLGQGLTALIDDGDFDVVAPHKWWVWVKKTPLGATYGPYAQTAIRSKGRQRSVFMHNMITGHRGIDHINHDGLDNRRANLRPASVAQNRHNTRSHAGSSSKHKGVTWHKASRKWQAAIKVNDVSRYLGTFASEESAARAYNEAAFQAYGEYAYLNELTADLSPLEWLDAEIEATCRLARLP